ncbi:MAG: response regulator [Deltaproteobacteria bacterium]|nr:response regulator [Deltaproteobacteria bacterium]
MSEHTVLVIDDSPTILKVVQLVLAKAGYRVVTAPDGEAGLEAAREHKPDLILLDFVMPKMNGYQVCRELAQDSELKDVAVVLMSAKGDQVGERFVKVMGIVDYITKPFSPEAITAVVQHSVEKYAKRPTDDRTKPILKSAVDELERSRADAAAAEADERGRTEALSTLRSKVADMVAGPISEHLEIAAAAGEGGSSPDTETISELVLSTLNESALAKLVDVLEPVMQAGASTPSLRGDLRVVPIAEVLQLLDQQNQSGVLQVTRGESTVEISFRDGRVELATATGVAEEFLLGRFVSSTGLMEDDDLDQFLESRTPGSKLMGSQLVKLGYLSPEQLSQVLATQTRELIYEILRWSFGTFRFRRTRELPTIAADAALGLGVEEILMEGFRRVDEWHMIEREVSDFDQVFLRNEDAVARMGRSRLTREEQTVLEMVNGKNTVKEIIRSSRMGSFEVSKMLYRLLSIKLVRTRVAPVAV